MGDNQTEIRVEEKPLNPAWYVALTASIIVNVVSVGLLYLAYTGAPREIGDRRFDGDCASVEYVDSVARNIKQEIERTRCHCRDHRPGFPGAPVGAAEK